MQDCRVSMLPTYWLTDADEMNSLNIFTIPTSIEAIGSMYHKCIEFMITPPPPKFKKEKIDHAFSCSTSLLSPFTSLSLGLS